MEPILSIRNLKTFFPVKNNRQEKQVVRAVNDVDLDVFPGEVLGVVGESGSGKSTLAYTIMGMYPQAEGTLIYRGKELPLQSRKRPIEVKKSLQLVFQDPGSSLNPSQTVGEIVPYERIIKFLLKYPAIPM